LKLVELQTPNSKLQTGNSKLIKGATGKSSTEYGAEAEKPERVGEGSFKT